MPTKRIKKKCLQGFYLIVRTLDRKSISIKKGDVAKNNQTNIRLLSQNQRFLSFKVQKV